MRTRLLSHCVYRRTLAIQGFRTSLFTVLPGIRKTNMHKQSPSSVLSGVRFPPQSKPTKIVTVTTHYKKYIPFWSTSIIRLLIHYLRPASPFHSFFIFETVRGLSNLSTSHDCLSNCLTNRYLVVLISRSWMIEIWGPFGGLYRISDFPTEPLSSGLPSLYLSKYVSKSSMTNLVHRGNG